jgi:hypothetical protein
MRKLLLLLFVLVGCQTPVVAPSPAESSPPVPGIIARGTDGINDWSCSLEELNHDLVWVKCDFQNHFPKIAGNSTANSCTKVTFYDEGTMKPVVQSRKVCSGPLHVGAKSENYAAFIKKDRVALRRCGELLDLCVMLAGNENP